MYFERSGEENTEATLKIAKEAAIAKGIKHIIVATTTGKTGLIAAEMLKGSGINLIVVTHNTGFKENGIQEINLEMKEKIEAQGAKVLTCPMVLRALGAAIREKTGYSQEQIVADTLRIFGQGTKVALEITAMASDCGLIPPIEVIAVAGTAKGADTACVIKPASSNNFFKMWVSEILAKPK
ncbi:hypothetical protein KKH65_04035 [bacterium]|nr:hypothetical protein [bacterium]MBU2462027.1 hypothetical protein [bacterium]